MVHILFAVEGVFPKDLETMSTLQDSGADKIKDVALSELVRCIEDLSGVPKNVLHLIKNKTKVFCLISEIFFCIR